MKKTLTTLLLASVSITRALAAQPQDLQGEEAKAALTQYEARISANASDVDALKSAGIILHQLNRGHADPQQVSKAEGYLEKAKDLQASDQETAAWLGSLTTMKALFETDPGQQSFYVKLGTRMLDKAIQKAPDNLVVRLTRAYNSLELPPFLKRTKFAVEDFKHYLKLCEAQSCPQPYVSDAASKLAAAEKILADNL